MILNALSILYVVAAVANVLIAVGYVPPSAQAAGFTAAVLFGMLLCATGAARRTGAQLRREFEERTARGGEDG